MDRVYQEIYDRVCALPVIDTHEHLPHFDITNVAESDILADYLEHYLSSDLVSAGLSLENLDKVRDPRLPVSERWSLVEPYWRFCRYTGYGRALDLAVQGIYGIPGINRDTIEDLNQAYNGRRSPGHFRYVLKDLCNIELSILDSWASHKPYDRSLFRYAWQPAKYIEPWPDTIKRIEENGSVVQSLGDWLEAFDNALAENLDRGIIALKNAMAYERTLRYEKVDYATADAAFKRDLAEWRLESKTGQANLEFSTEVQDFLMHHCLQLANDKGLVMQVHTGLQEGNGNVLTNSDPALLTNLFLEYPNVVFDLFHISYPFQGMAGALAKTFPNVRIDMCWAHIISPAAAVHALSDFLDAVPYNKIMGFGGDYLFVDGVYGHLQLARENISRSLADKVHKGVFSVDSAVDIAEHLLYHNPRQLFDLDIT